jgi:sugar O-acyltransferase (sialic acid O-acetyltransferase NeuD family)
MKDPYEVLIPLLNPNEPEAQVTALHVSEGQKVRKGDTLCTLETTKSSQDVLVEQAGYVVGLLTSVGSKLRAGERLCWLAGSKGWKPPKPAAAETVEGVELPEGLRITEPALKFARDSEIELTSLPRGPLVTREMLKRSSPQVGAREFKIPKKKYSERSLVVYGGGGHGKTLIELIRAVGDYKLAGVIDDGLEVGSEVMGSVVIGGGEALVALAERGVRMAVNAVGGVGDITSRIAVFERIRKAGLTCPMMMHPSAVVEESARLAEGVQVFSHGYIGSDAQIGFGVIVNTQAVVSHDCHLGDYANIAPGALLAGGVSIGEGTLVGMGVTINLNVTIGPDARVGNSAVVKQDVPGGGMVRAGSIWP